MKELDYYQYFQAKCLDNATKMQKMADNKLVFDFLVGLVGLDVRIQLLGRDPFPTLKQTYSYV